jgi:hypothetical protein
MSETIDRSLLQTMIGGTAPKPRPVDRIRWERQLCLPSGTACCPQGCRRDARGLPAVGH